MNVWIVRWKKDCGTRHIFNTQGTNFRVFDSLENAEEFSKELHTRIEFRYRADTGFKGNSWDFSMMAPVRMASSGHMDEAGSYKLDDIYGVTIEIVCAEVNDAVIAPEEVEVS